MEHYPLSSNYFLAEMPLLNEAFLRLGTGLNVSIFKSLGLVLAILSGNYPKAAKLIISL